MISNVDQTISRGQIPMNHLHFLQVSASLGYFNANFDGHRHRQRLIALLDESQVAEQIALVHVLEYEVLWAQIVVCATADAMEINQIRMI